MLQAGLVDLREAGGEPGFAVLGGVQQDMIGAGAA